MRDGVWSAGRGREELGRRRSKGAVDADAGGEKASVRRKPTLKQMLSSASEQARWLPLLQRKLSAQGPLDGARRLVDLFEEVVRVAASVDIAGRDRRCLEAGLTRDARVVSGC